MRRLLVAVPLVAACLAAEPKPIVLGGPEITRVAWDACSLVSADFDGDGRLDAALINNESGKIVLLYQRAPGEAAGKNARRAVSHDRWEPVIEDSRFEKVSLPTDQRHFAMVAADFDGDGRPDLALTGAEDALTVRFQGADGKFAKTWKYKDFEPLQGTQHLVTADLNGDGRADLAVLGKGKLLVFLQKPTGGFGEPIVYLTGEDRVGQLFAQDADGDGRTDLLYLAGGGDGTMRWRKQTAPGVFSAEMSLPYAFPAYDAAPSHDAQGRLIFTRVNAKSHLIERHAFTTHAAEPGDTLLPTVHNLPAGVKSSAHVLADFNGDGLPDIAYADTNGAQIVLFLQQPDGSFAEPRTFPSFSGISGIAAVAIPGVKGAALAVASRKEGLGISRLTADGRLEFPVSIPVKGEPAAIATMDGKATVLVDDKSQWRLDTLNTTDGVKWTAVSRSVGTLKHEPAGMAAGDLNGDGRSDLLLMLPREPALIFPGTADGPGVPLKETAAIRSQLTDLTPERVAILDLDGDKRAEIVIGATGYARSIRLTADGTDVTVVDQFNARRPDDKLATPAFIDIEGDGKKELVFNEAGSAFFQMMKKDPSGVYRVTRRLEGAPGDSVQALPIALDRDKSPHLLVAGRGRFWTAPCSGSRTRLELVDSYDTDLQNCSYYHAFTADLRGDKKPVVVAFDLTSNLIEFLAPGTDAAKPWTSLMHFVLFDINLHYRGRKGLTFARETLTGDFTGDGRPDLLMLVHDRVLLYPQE